MTETLPVKSVSRLRYKDFISNRRMRFIAIAFVSSGMLHTTAKAERLKSITAPKIDLVYPVAGTIFDRTCANFLKDGGANGELIAKAAELKSELQREWDNEGRRYLEYVVREVGTPFPYKEMQATLTVCPADTMSMPLLINVRRFLPDSPIVPPREDFSERLFHELMHHYVAIVRGSPLQTKYAGEPLTTLYHLHVMALEKLVLIKFNRTDELKFLDQEYRTEPAPGHYKRAWEIVSDVEGYEAFVDELKRAAKVRH